MLSPLGTLSLTAWTTHGETRCHFSHGAVLEELGSESDSTCFSKWLSPFVRRSRFFSPFLSLIFFGVFFFFWRSSLLYVSALRFKSKRPELNYHLPLCEMLRVIGDWSKCEDKWTISAILGVGGWGGGGYLTCTRGVTAWSSEQTGSLSGLIFSLLTPAGAVLEIWK